MTGETKVADEIKDERYIIVIQSGVCYTLTVIDKGNFLINFVMENE